LRHSSLRAVIVPPEERWGRRRRGYLGAEERIVITAAHCLTDAFLANGTCAYYFSGGLVPAGDGGWKKDGIDGGRIILNFINGEVDLLIKNATGTTASVKQDGGKIIVRKTNNGLIALTIVYEGETATTEEYVFQIDDRGDGMVASTAIRTAGKINKVSLMTASCRRPR
jgi:hypothetical protein